MDKKSLEWVADALKQIMDTVSEIPTQSGQLEEDLDTIFKLAEEGLEFLSDHVEDYPNVH
jgi:hypothetical protein